MILFLDFNDTHYVHIGEINMFCGSDISEHQCLTFKFFVEINLHKCFEFMFWIDSEYWHFTKSHDFTVFCNVFARWQYNLMKIRSLICSPLLVYCAKGDLKKPHYGLHAIDPIFHPMKMVITRIWKCYRAVLLRTIWLRYIFMI
jgi:hypothetical protein